MRITISELVPAVEKRIKHVVRRLRNTINRDAILGAAFNEEFILIKNGKQYGFADQRNRINTLFSDEYMRRDYAEDVGEIIIELIQPQKLKLEKISIKQSNSALFTMNLDKEPEQEFEMKEIYVEEYTEIIPEQRVTKKRLAIKKESMETC